MRCNDDDRVDNRNGLGELSRRKALDVPLNEWKFHWGSRKQLQRAYSELCDVSGI